MPRRWRISSSSGSRSGGGGVNAEGLDMRGMLDIGGTWRSSRGGKAEANRCLRVAPVL